MYLGGQIHPVVGKTYPLDEVPAGLRELAERKILGKAVVVMD
jgi:NADPH:quinone reductase-like Zn-dependent oxidoreductase